MRGAGRMEGHRSEGCWRVQGYRVQVGIRREERRGGKGGKSKRGGTRREAR